MIQWFIGDKLAIILRWKRILKPTASLDDGKDDANADLDASAK